MRLKNVLVVVIAALMGAGLNLLLPMRQAEEPPDPGKQHRDAGVVSRPLAGVASSGAEGDSQPTAISSVAGEHPAGVGEVRLERERRKLVGLTESLQQQMAVFERSRLTLGSVVDNPDHTEVTVSIKASLKGESEDVNRHVVNRLDAAPRFMREEYSSMLEGAERRFNKLNKQPRTTRFEIPKDPDAGITVRHFVTDPRTGLEEPLLVETLSSAEFGDTYHKYIELQVE